MELPSWCDVRGSRNGLKIRWEKSRVGSIPTASITDVAEMEDAGCVSFSIIECRIVGSNPIVSIQ